MRIDLIALVGACSVTPTTVTEYIKTYACEKIAAAPEYYVLKCAPNAVFDAVLAQTPDAMFQQGKMDGFIAPEAFKDTEHIYVGRCRQRKITQKHIRTGQEFFLPCVL